MNEQKGLYFYSEVKVNWKNEVKTRKAAFAGIQQGDNLHIGLSVCSEQDVYDKKKGRKIAEGRAMKKPAVIVDLRNYPGEKLSNVFVNQVKKLLH